MPWLRESSLSVLNTVWGAAETTTGFLRSSYRWLLIANRSVRNSLKVCFSQFCVHLVFFVFVFLGSDLERKLKFSFRAIQAHNLDPGASFLDSFSLPGANV